MKTNNNKEVEVKVEQTKSYDEKVKDYKKHFNVDLGMTDPGTEARIEAMETKIPRDIRENDDLADRNDVREAKANELRDAKSELRKNNVELSDVLTNRKEEDEEVAKPLQTVKNKVSK